MESFWLKQSNYSSIIQVAEMYSSPKKFIKIMGEEQKSFKKPVLVSVFLNFLFIDFIFKFKNEHKKKNPRKNINFIMLAD